MKIVKFWYIFCFTFAFYSIDTLVEESYEMVYEKSNETEPFSYLACEKLSNLYANETAIDLEELRHHLYEYFKSSDIGENWRKSYLEETEKFVLNRTISGGYLIFDGRVCLIANTERELLHMDSFLSKSKMFFVIKRDTLDFVKMARWNDRIDQSTVLKKAHP